MPDRYDPALHQNGQVPPNGGPADKFGGGTGAANEAARPPRPPQPEAPVGRPRLELSLTQILGSTAAAVTAAFLGSRLGVAGTLIGAALASVISVVGGAVYTTSIKATKHRVAQAIVAVRGPDGEDRPDLFAVVAAGRRPPIAEPRDVRSAAVRPSRPALRGALVGASLSVVVFVAALTVITGYESISGTALAGQAGGLTVLGGTDAGSAKKPSGAKPAHSPAAGSVAASVGRSSTSATPRRTAAVTGAAKTAPNPVSAKSTTTPAAATSAGRSSDSPPTATTAPRTATEPTTTRTASSPPSVPSGPTTAASGTSAPTIGSATATDPTGASPRVETNAAG